MLRESNEAFILEQEAVVEAGKKVALTFPFEVPTGTLECSALYDSGEVAVMVEVYEKESGKLVGKYTTPFTTELKIGEYRLRATHPSPER